MQPKGKFSNISDIKFRIGIWAVDNTAVLIYIIDIQNTLRLKESISYLKDVVKTFKKMEISPPIYVFLHKFDPVLKKNAPVETAKRILDIKNKI